MKKFSLVVPSDGEVVAPHCHAKDGKRATEVFRPDLLSLAVENGSAVAFDVCEAKTGKCVSMGLAIYARFSFHVITLVPAKKT